MWKNKGNEYFKFGDFLKAKECYSSSLAVLESNAAYTNRALACIKLKEWQQAEEDCTQACHYSSQQSGINMKCSMYIPSGAPVGFINFVL